MTQDEIKLILDKHKKWLNDEEGGERADLRYADLCDADLRDADLRGADLRGADLRNANLRYADLRDADLCDAVLRGADLRDANLDYSCWPIWCGSLGVHIDERIALQLLYHTLYNVAYSEHVSDEVKRTLLTPDVVMLANRSHVVSKRGKEKINPYKEDNHDRTT